MATFELLQKKLKSREYEFAIPHFFEEMANDDLDMIDIETSILNGKIKRRFSRDPRGVRYEVVGTALDGRKVAIICRIKNTGKPLLITTYALE